MLHPHIQASRCSANTSGPGTPGLVSSLLIRSVIASHLELRYEVCKRTIELESLNGSRGPAGWTLLLMLEMRFVARLAAGVTFRASRRGPFHDLKADTAFVLRRRVLEDLVKIDRTALPYERSQAAHFSRYGIWFRGKFFEHKANPT